MRANADTPEDAAKAREFGAQGIGLCRTEHMFMAEDRLPVVREMIMASSEEERRRALEKLLPHQQADFEGIFEAMAGLPVTIRLLDPPLHEFLPPLDEATDDKMRDRIRALQEANPMLGTRGCRLGLMWPEIYEMQVRAIVRAAIAVEERTGNAPLVEIMHPLVGFGEELRRLRALTIATAAEEARDRVPRRDDDRAPARVRPRRRDRRARGLLLLRDERPDPDGARLLARRRRGQVPDALPRGRRARAEPVRDDRPGWGGDLMRIAVERGRSVKDDLKIGICGEHGGEPTSVAFCHELGLEYVSCSPYRVPLARLAAAQAALKESGIEAVAAGG